MLAPPVASACSSFIMLEVGGDRSLYFDKRWAFERGWQSELSLCMLPDGL